MDILSTLIKRTFCCLFNEDEDEDTCSTTPTYYPAEAHPVIRSAAASMRGASLHAPSSHTTSINWPTAQNHLSASHPANGSLSSRSSSVRHPTMMLSGACNNRAMSMAGGDPSWKMTLPRGFATLPQTQGLGGYPSAMRHLGVPSSRRVDVRDVSFTGSVASGPDYSSDSRWCTVN